MPNCGKKAILALLHLLLGAGETSLAQDASQGACRIEVAGLSELGAQVHTLERSLAQPSFSVQAPFSVSEDALCFENLQPGFSTAGAFPFGIIGERAGVCQGVDGIAASFKRNVRFDPGLARPSEGEAQLMIDTAYALYTSGCDNPFTVPGFANMREFCAAHSRYLRMRAVDLNLGIAMRQVVPLLGEFIGMQDGAQMRARTQATIQSLTDELRAGRRPIVMYRSHSELVYGVARRSDTLNGVTGTYVVLSTYDPNYRSLRKQLWVRVDPLTGAPLDETVHMVQEGMARPYSSSRSPLWDISPDRRREPRGCQQAIEEARHLFPQFSRPQRELNREVYPF